jgi:A-kinase anchor protein 1
LLPFNLFQQFFFFSFQNSSDSGKGSSEINRNETLFNSALIAVPPSPVVATFQFPNALLHAFFGRNHTFFNTLRMKSEAEITIEQSPYDAESSICTIIGLPDQLHHAIMLLHSRFPPSKYPYFDPQNEIPPIVQPQYPVVPMNYNLQLSSGICDVILASMNDVGQLFLHQPNHPTSTSIRNLLSYLNAAYSSTDTPALEAFQTGIVCVAPFQDAWHRAMIYQLVDESTCLVRLADVGTLVQVPLNMLRQITHNFMELPFQACECALSGIQPIDRKHYI